MGRGREQWVGGGNASEPKTTVLIFTKLCVKGFKDQANFWYTRFFFYLYRHKHKARKHQKVIQ